MKIEIDLRIIFLVLLFVFTSQTYIYLLFIAFIFFHEMAHIIVGKISGLEIESISFGIFGFSAQIYNYGEEKVLSKIFTYLAGPSCNLILALIFYLNKSRIELIQINLILGVLNLLPILPLDGGRILKEIIKIFYGHKVSTIFMVKFTKFILVLLSLLYSIIILKIKNIAILFLMFYLWWLYIIEERKAVTLKRVYGIIEKSIEKNLV